MDLLKSGYIIAMRSCIRDFAFLLFTLIIMQFIYKMENFIIFQVEDQLTTIRESEKGTNTSVKTYKRTNLKHKN